MTSYLNEEYKMRGVSGREYTFTMYGFVTLDNIQESLKDYRHAGLYVFTIRRYSQALRQHTYEPVYVGETGCFQARGFANHHKREEIEDTGSHSFGICLLDSIGDEHRLEMEKDIIDAYELRCNDTD